MSEIKRAVTHNGPFHPDDVLAGALLRKIYPGIEIVRSRDDEVIASADIVFDVGRTYDVERQRFDHHQMGAPERDINRIAYSAFGLLWLEYGTAYCDNDEEVARAVDARLVQVIDANDNGTALTTQIVPGVAPYEVFDVIFSYNPLFGSDEKYDVQYEKAVAVAAAILEREVAVERANKQLKNYFATEYEYSSDPRYVVLDVSGNYKETAATYENLLYYVSPDDANQTWGVTAVSQPGDVFTSKKPFPEEWKGLQGMDLARITGVEDAEFCHLKRFLAVAKSKEGALKLLAQALQ